MHKYSFEKLEVWRLSIEFVKKIYKLVENFPNSEKYGITDQIKRAVVSVPTNLSEGSGRNTGKDKAHYTQMAYGSMMESLNLLIIAKELCFIDEDTLDNLRLDIEVITTKLSNLRRSQLKQP